MYLNTFIITVFLFNVTYSGGNHSLDILFKTLQFTFVDPYVRVLKNRLRSSNLIDHDHLSEC